VAGFRAEARQWARRHAAPALSGARRDGRDYRQQHGFLSTCRLASGRLLRRSPPFSARCRSMGLGRGAVDHVDIRVGCLHQGVKQSPPNSACRPPMETVVDCRWRSVAGRTILPPAPRSQHMNDAADDPAVIRATSAGLVHWEMRINRRPSLVAKPEKPAHHPLRHALAPRESDLLIPFNTLIGFRP